MQARTHLALDKDAPIAHPVMPPSAGCIVATAQVGGPHHRYDRAVDGSLMRDIDTRLVRSWWHRVLEKPRCHRS